MSCSAVVVVRSQGNGSPIPGCWCWLHCGHSRTGAEAPPPSPQSGWAAVFFGPRSSAAIPPSSKTSPKKLRGGQSAHLQESEPAMPYHFWNVRRNSGMSPAWVLPGDGFWSNADKPSAGIRDLPGCFQKVSRASQRVLVALRPCANHFRLGEVPRKLPGAIGHGETRGLWGMCLFSVSNIQYYFIF